MRGPDPQDEPRAVPIEDALDLHTFHPRDVAEVVAEYLREAARRGFSEVRIIHGKGIGVQRRIVAGVLDRHPAVASYQLASADRGHYGATVVRLRPVAEDAQPE
ncbi:MAG: Smr/MutS family protein [Candidatus Eisenbacteria sp.]|nr:Smr/MutS family protein [Candidatus Eisenbacteria bacterium]